MLRQFIKPRTILDDIVEWKKGFREGTSDQFFAEYVIVSEMHWTWDDIENMPEFEYLKLQKLIQTKHTVEKIENKKIEDSHI